MTRAGHLLLIGAVIAIFATGCATSTNTSGSQATPVPTQKPVFIPTTAPVPPTPGPAEPTAVVALQQADDTASAGTADVNESDGPDSEQAGGSDATEDDDATDEAATPGPTETPQIIPVPTQPPRSTRVPVPPTPRPIQPAPPSICPGGQVLVGSSCGCPAGQTNRASDGQCVRFCNQADLTISNTCVCAGDLYDNGGQCVKRCNPGEVTDQFGGCKFP